MTLRIGLPRLHVYTVLFRVFAKNVYKIGLTFTQTLPCYQRRSWLIASSNEHPALNHQSVYFLRFGCINLIKYLLQLELRRTCSTDSILR